jgi:CelD/BcsL family acetyltransferase involved in cellulose biosynthesis/acyl carrier protein
MAPAIDVTSVLRAVLADVLGCSAAEVQAFRDDTPLLGARPELDPFTAAGLIGELEARLQIQIDERELDIAVLRTFGSLSRFVEDAIARPYRNSRPAGVQDGNGCAAASVIFSLEQPDELQLRDWWTDLEHRADPTFFLSWMWIGTWIEQAGLPHSVLVGRQDGRIVCLGLLRKGVEWRHRAVRSRTIYLNETGNRDEDILYIEHNGFLCDPAVAGLVPRAIGFLRGNSDLGRFDEIQLGGVPEALYRELQESGFKLHLVNRKPTAFVDLRGLRETGTSYLSTLSSNTRYQVKRAVKMYEKRGAITVEPARDTQQALHYFDQLGALHEASWNRRGSPGAWSYPFLVAFHRRLIERSFADGGIDIVKISCGGRPIGYIHCLVREGWIGSYLSGFAYEDDNKLKPGLVSFYHYIEHQLRAGGDTIDFLAGDQRYKMSLGQPGPSMCWVRLQESRPHLMIEQGLRQAKNRLQAMRPTRRPGASINQDDLQAA